MSAVNEEAVPVFVSATELNFQQSNKCSAKLFTLYNPYGYNISYKVLCTATRSYTISDACGHLQAKTCKDIVVRCLQRSQIGNVDKLKIEIMKRGESEVIGSRIILLNTVSNDFVESESSKFDEKAMRQNMMSSSVNVERSADQPQNLIWILLSTALLCGIALICPTAGENTTQGSSLPPFLHITLPQKLVASYVLGIVTILILRPV